MKTIRFSEKEDSNVIDIEDVIENRNKIYCSVREGNTLWFLVKLDTDQYKWCNLQNGLLNNISYTTFNNAIRKSDCSTHKVLIFDSQCEVLKYAKTIS